MSSSQQVISSITIYFGLPVFVCGTFGNLINVRCLWKIRRNPCGFIFSMSSIANFIAIVYGLFTRILSAGFNLEWSNTNVIWCKLRIPLTQAFVLISISCICLASVDRFFNSSRQAKLRNLSKLSTVKWTISLITFFWLLHSIPLIIYTDLTRSPTSTSMTCSINSTHHFNYYRIYVILPLYQGVFPSTILIIAGLKTYYNTNKLQSYQQRQLIQKQLTLITIIQAPIIVLSTLPYAVMTAYTTLTANIIKSTYQKSMENIILAICTILLYFAFSCQIFVFYICSPAFRQEFKSFILRYKMQNTQVHPITSTNN